jgi:hypothetical protein
MKFFAPVAIFAAGVAASRYQQRDLAQVEAAVSKVLDGLKAYDVEINKFEGGDPSNLSGATATMVNIVKVAIDGLQVATNVSIEEAMNFKPLSDAMNVAGDAVLTDLKAKVDLFTKLHLCAYFYPVVSELGDNVVILMNTVASKFPSPDASKDEIEHFTTTFAALEQSLKDCSYPPSAASVVTDCPTGGSGVYPTSMVTSVPSSLPYGPYTPKVSSYVPNPTKIVNVTTVPTSTSKPVVVVTAGATGLKFSVGAVLAAGLVALLL